MQPQYLRQLQTRRNFFLNGVGGLGTIALSRLMAQDHAPGGPVGPSSSTRAEASALPAKAKNVIFLFMEGGPSQLDLFDLNPCCRSGTGSRCPRPSRRIFKLAFVA